MNTPTPFTIAIEATITGVQLGSGAAPAGSDEVHVAMTIDVAPAASATTSGAESASVIDLRQFESMVSWANRLFTAPKRANHPSQRSPEVDIDALVTRILDEADEAEANDSATVIELPVFRDRNDEDSLD